MMMMIITIIIMIILSDEIKGDEIEIMTVEEKVDYLKLMPSFNKWNLPRY